MIIRALKETNSNDYTPEIIARVERSFGPDAVVAGMDRQSMFTAELDGRIVGTASLDQTVIRSVFVAPDVQGQGVGRSLMAKAVGVAVSRGVTLLSVRSTVTAEAFYARLGFKAVRDAFYEDERTIVMERLL